MSLATLLSAKAADKQETAIKDFGIIYSNRVAAVEKASPAELRRILQEPMTDIKLSALMDDPSVELTKGSMRDFFETEVVSPKGDKLTLHNRGEYWRRLVAFNRLLDAKKVDVLDWFVQRKEIPEPTLLDALFVFAAVSQEGLAQQAGGDVAIKWKKLFRAKNPMCRMLAIMHVERWTKKEEIPALLEKGLSDEYWYTRYLTLNAYKNLTPQGTREKMQAFLKRKLPKDLPQKHSNKEDLLNATAREILQKLQTP